VGCDSEYQKAQIEKLTLNSEKTVKKEVDFEALQEVPPFASA